MTIPWGNNKLNVQQCTPFDEQVNLQRIEARLEAIESGAAVDTYTVYGAAGDTDPQPLWEKIEDHSTYSGASHQLVYAEQVVDGGAITVRLFTDLASGGADTYQVKLTVSDTAEYLPAKFVDFTGVAYNAATDFRIRVSVEGGTDLRLWSGSNIIKTGSGDSSPGHLGDKFADLDTFNGTNHFTVSAQNTGSTMKLFGNKADIETIVTAVIVDAELSPGAVRFVKLTPSSAPSGATLTGSSITPQTKTGTEIVWNDSTNKWDLTADSVSFQWIRPEAVYVPADRFRVGELIPSLADPDILMLLPPSCQTYEEP